MKSNFKIFSVLSAVLLAALCLGVQAQETVFWGAATYSPLDLFLPNKYGFTLGGQSSKTSAWELEYLHGGLSFPWLLKDLGKMSDNRLSVSRRSFWGQSSWNLSYGLTYFEFTSHLGNKILSSATDQSIPSIDLVGVHSLGFHLGIGNRWFFRRHWMFGVDWISWAQPLWLLDRNSVFLDHSNNRENKDRVESVIRTLSRFPRFALFKIQLGFYF